MSILGLGLGLPFPPKKVLMSMSKNNYLKTVHDIYLNSPVKFLDIIYKGLIANNTYCCHKLCGGHVDGVHDNVSELEVGE